MKAVYFSFLITVLIASSNYKNIFEYIYLYKTKNTNDISQKTIYLKKILNLNSKNEVTNFELGNIYLKQNNLNDSKKYFLNTINLNPKNEVANILLKDIFLKENDYKKAKCIIHKILKSNKSKSDLLDVLDDIDNGCNSNKKTESKWVSVNIKKQKVYICEKSELLRIMKCSTSKKEYIPTPTGLFKLINKEKSFFSTKYQQGAKYWVGFIGSRYGFHSIPFDSNWKLIKEEENKLGYQVTHGCVRLSLENAQWFYENLPLGTLVHIK